MQVLANRIEVQVHNCASTSSSFRPRFACFDIYFFIKFICGLAIYFFHFQFSRRQCNVSCAALLFFSLSSCYYYMHWYNLFWETLRATKGRKREKCEMNFSANETKRKSSNEIKVKQMRYASSIAVFNDVGVGSCTGQKPEKIWGKCRCVELIFRRPSV